MENLEQRYFIKRAGAGRSVNGFVHVASVFG
jgi:hypothetical protein